MWSAVISELKGELYRFERGQAIVLIHDGELILRSTIADDPELKKLQEDARILKHMSETRMYPFAMPSQMSFRIESEGKVIGEVSLKTIRWFNRKAEISIFIVPEYQGKGYGKRALKKIMELAFGTFNLYRLEAGSYGIQ